MAVESGNFMNIMSGSLGAMEAFTQGLTSNLQTADTSIQDQAA